MYTSFLNHYYLANVHQAIALGQAPKQLTLNFDHNSAKHSIDESAAGDVSAVTSLSELDRVWLHQLRKSQ